MSKHTVSIELIFEVEETELAGTHNADILEEQQIRELITKALENKETEILIQVMD